MDHSKTKATGIARGVLYFVCTITLVVGISVAFEGATDHERLLGSTFGAGMGLFGLALTSVLFRTLDRGAWLALWYLPVFFAIHIAVVNTWVPDGPLLVMSAGALLACRGALVVRSRPVAGRVQEA